MIKKISVLVLAYAFLLNSVAMIFAAPETKTTAAQTGQLAALLPASDGIVTIDMRRLVNDALPQVLSSNQPLLTDILGTFDRIKTDTGIDLRQFEQIAVGISGRKVSATETTFEPIVLARGTFNAGAFLGVAKVAAKGKYREEKIGAKTAYIFSVKQAAAQVGQNPNKSKSSKIGNTVDKIFKGLSDEFAVTAYDNNTLAIGTVARVRDALNSKTRVSTDVLGLINRKPNSLISFGVNLPNGLARLIDLDNDEIGKNLEAIRQISGAIDIGGGNTTVSLVAKTLEAAQAKDLQDTLTGLQMIGKAFIGSGSGEDKKVYARMIDNARITQSGNNVMLDLQVAQSDIDILIGAK